ncbi:hypothetical protein PISMIDRAFT_227384 [Pisolithus microcarpus 441]|uniref:Uncharacterized protein n=1 Tax=Pisolithus microcarpus 441 TaxID=765257 RepID=A0A0C9YL58_9AGAM|nr:hypothetical protein PISMIDRAFT_227384 [Pisolithus microcarpus 441]
MSDKGSTATPSFHPSRRSADNLVERMMNELQEAVRPLKSVFVPILPVCYTL